MRKLCSRIAAMFVICAVAGMAVILWPPGNWREGEGLAQRWLHPAVIGVMEWLSDTLTGVFLLIDPNITPDCGDPVALQAVPESLRFRTPVKPGSEIVVAAVGDLLIQTSLQDQGASHPFGFMSLWHGTADLMRAADITYANLEGTVAQDIAVNGSVSEAPLPPADRRVYTGYPQFNYPPVMLSALAAIGVDVVSTANNHALDRYWRGVDRTLDALNQAGIKATGTRRSTDTEERWYTLTRAKGRTIAWLACSYGTNGIADTKNQVLLCYHHRDKVLEIIRTLRTNPVVDAIILTPHWGREYTHEPDAAQRALARKAVEAGADAVIGTHPHVVQPWEIHRTKSGHEGLIVYSTSNYVGGYRSLERRTAMIVLAGFGEAEDGRLVIAGARYIPLRMTFDAPAQTGRITVQVIDRAGPAGRANRAHITKLVPAGLIHPPRTPLSTLAPCPAPKILTG
jgi:poly-gamma-glutamate capsule biosynthesis protein CapA/YwtB (metallophosphatase superfamily)